jgi:DNA mismatch repair ATPase MutS
VDFILTTHYTGICKKMRSEPRICNYKMDVERTAQDKLTYTYKIKPGICNIQGAIEILKTMEYPTEIINTIKNFKGPL